ncbi:MAG: DUF1801 domain-containing protein [Ignavibacteriaceae bacterium]|nr:DUF1801 domain-containing protein [Ignavibacteriaceae bacterium]
MAELKTRLNNGSVNKFLKSVGDKKKQEDSFKVLELMKKVTKEEPKMWGPSIVGFGSYHYKYESDREGDMCIIGFSPRKQSLTIYIMPGFKKFDSLMKKLGKYKTGVSCLYIKKLEDVDLKVLKQLIIESVKYMKRKKW